MAISNENVKKFWEAQAAKYNDLGSAKVTNLEENDELFDEKVVLENEKVFSLLPLDSSMTVLDLGAGIGAWSAKLSPLVKQIHAVEYCPQLIEIGRQNCARDKIENISFFESAAESFISDSAYDLVFISGLLLYLNDSSLEALFANLNRMTNSGALLFLREATGLEGRYELHDKFSEALQQYYSAIYRDREDLIATAKGIGFSLVKDDDMFPANHRLNKWIESRLRVYLFKKD